MSSLSNPSSEQVVFVCPCCKVEWADVNVRFGFALRASDIRMRSPFKKKDAIKKDETLVCPNKKCRVKFTSMHVQIMVAQGLYAKEMLGSKKEKENIF